MIMFKHARNVFLEGVVNDVLNEIVEVLGVDISKDKVEKAMAHFAKNMSLEWMDTNELFKKHAFQ